MQLPARAQGWSHAWHERGKAAGRLELTAASNGVPCGPTCPVLSNMKQPVPYVFLASPGRQRWPADQHMSSTYSIACIIPC